jgi:hypothetical protein
VSDELTPGANPGAPSARARFGPLLNLRRGLDLLLLRRVSPEDFVCSFDQLLVLLLLGVLVWVGLEWVHKDADTNLGLDAFYGLAVYALIGLFLCAWVARMNGRDADTRALLIPLLSVAPYVLIVFSLGSDLANRTHLATLALILGRIYLVLLGGRLLHAAFGSVRLGAYVTVILLVLLTKPLVLDPLNLDTRLWVPPEASEQEDPDDAIKEPLLYEQPERIASAVERVAPPRRGSPGVYLVGFAGDGDQEIFKREALLAERVLSAHFGSQGHSLELINDIDDRETYPLASLTGLEQALKLLAARMDVSRDLLVLTLTSHGYEGGLEVSNGTLPLLQLEPADLKEALDESGIRWRVVIVSACYAGVFVDTLKNDTTLIITAADAEHSSFGCEEDRELTYFGEAFLKSSVPSTDTLEQAFRKAAGLIAARETAEHKKEHSNPQLYMGARMREKLAALEVAAHPHDSRSLIVNLSGRP